ncbi:MAG: radical SAM protein [Cyanobacteria bacterium SZAS LIN-2]|nr:radical SAM protein [Cyanobacteria bacterium SZAS LIN-2]
MKYHTFCIVAGSLACNARCAWCVAGMTPKNQVSDAKAPEIDVDSFQRACRIAEMNNLDTARITSKGEPTIFPEQVTQYLQLLQPWRFPFIEMQTNGILIAKRKPVTDEHLRTWRKLGLTHMCISVVSSDPERNRLNYTPREKQYIDLPKLIDDLHAFGFNVRMTLIMQRGDVDSPESLKQFMAFCRTHRVEQITALPVNKPTASRDGKLYDAAVKAALSDEQLHEIHAFADKHGAVIATLPWGAKIYDIGGQNLCLSSCLTVSPDANESRQLIFLPPGRITTDWQYEGAVIYDLPKAAQKIIKI